MEEKKTDKMEQPLFTRPEGGEEDEVTIDWMALIRRIFAIRRKLYLAAAVGLLAGVIIALSIPKQYTVSVTLSLKWAAARAGEDWQVWPPRFWEPVWAATVRMP